MWVWWIGTALASDPTLVAPGIDDLDRHAEAAERAVAEAEALGEAVARLHNAWVLDGHADRAKPCADPAGASIAARSPRFSAAWRDAVQAARLSSRRVDEARAAPTVEPLLDAPRTAELDALSARVARQERMWDEAAQWQRRHLPPCGGLVVAPGIPREEHAAPSDPHAGTAVLALDGGLVCPIGLPGVVVVPGEEACYGTDGCACEPLPVDPGAVLGP